MSTFINALQANDLEAIKKISKLIALSVRNGIEGFHTTYLSDEQMKELNPLIRNAVYNALFALSHYDIDDNSRKYIEYQIAFLPDYWEDPELYPQFEKSISGLQNKQITFSSEFLNEQYRLKNIVYKQNTGCIQIEGSYNFVGVDYDKRKSHLNKIRTHLKKENYYYDNGKEGYVKRLQEE